MMQMMIYLTAVLLIGHGLVHLLGFVAYWPLAEIEDLPYKTTLLGQRLSMGVAGMRVYSVFWLVTAVGLVTVAVGLMTRQAWWYPALWLLLSLSFLLIVLDWHNAYRGAVINLIIVVPLVLLGGLRIQPQPFASFPDQAPALTTTTLPAGLPPPVERFYQTISGDEVPVIDTAVITTRGKLRFAGITFPTRFRFTHEAGRNYRHYIEATLFGLPLMKINERYLDGRARMALPVGIIENEPKIDMAANLGLWGETIWLPSVYVLDPRVKWEGIDETTARLIVPFADDEDSFTVYFDAETGLIERMEAMRYREAADTEKILWQLEPLTWAEFQDIRIPSETAVTWADEGSPWLILTVEEVAYNVEVRDYIQTTGP